MKDFQYQIKFLESSEIMVAQTGQKTGEYKLVNIFIEFESILNKDLADKVRSDYRSGRQLWYDHITLLKSVVWKKDSIREDISVNIPRKSMKAIVLLFTKPGSKDSEEFINPKINKVSVTIEGKPNCVYSQGLPKSEIYEEAKRFFGNNTNACVDNLDKLSFLKNKCALVVDLRTVDQQYVIHTGRKIIGTQAGVMLAIEKSSTSTDLRCHIFVISDASLYFKDLKVSSFTV